MKSLFKLGLLFTLIIAGRYLQLTAPAAVAGLTPPPTAAQTLAPPHVTLTRYSPPTPAPRPVLVGQNKRRLASWY